MGRHRKVFWTGVLLPVVLVLGLVAAWAIDTGAAGGEVLRNVELADTDIGGLGSDELLEQIAAIDAATGDREVRIKTPEVTYETTASEIGLGVDDTATAKDALSVGRSAPLPVRPLRWLWSFVDPHTAELHHSVDAEVARTTLRKLEGSALVSPVEPTITSIEGDPFTVVPGRPGSGINPETLATALPAAADGVPIDEPITVRIRQTDLQPRLDDSVAEAAAAEANALTATPISITAGDRTIQLVPRELRELVVVREGEETLAVGLDEEQLVEVLDAEFADVVVEPEDASFTLSGGTPVIQPSVTGVTCCTADHATEVAAAFLAGEAEVRLELEEVEPSLTTAEAEALGIVEEIGQPNAFGPTTSHACCQNRVTNIHRIADIVRGAVIRPGSTFSINEYVGQRTLEKGFVSDGVIYDGVLTQDVGGGVSQFATTLFNAALYAGLDFGEYQSHSLYISRYPRGHEATISFPAPDLEIINNSPYGVLIWPEYTDTSITVRLFSTDHVDVLVGEPSPSPQGNCTRWTTPRTRTYEGGRVEQDTVYAVYRPGEGVDC